jgi:GMP synthase-like glutamine amidotransferase
MKVGVLEAGFPPENMVGRFGTYGNMFRRLLGPAFKLQMFDVQAGEYPTETDDCEAYLITGSSSGVYDGDPWIAPLEDFVRENVGAKRMVGICFGHQLMAQALGGKAEKSPKGWGIGLHRYDLTTKAPWMDDIHPIALPVSHQDQVTAIGPDARVLGGSEFTPFGLVDYPKLKAVSLQAHPEFDPDYAVALIESKRGGRFDAATADAAIASLREPNDRRRVTVWLRRFLNMK